MFELSLRDIKLIFKLKKCNKTHGVQIFLSFFLILTYFSDHLSFKMKNNRFYCIKLHKINTLLFDKKNKYINTLLFDKKN